MASLAAAAAGARANRPAVPAAASPRAALCKSWRRVGAGDTVGMASLPLCTGRRHGPTATGVLHPPRCSVARGREIVRAIAQLKLWYERPGLRRSGPGSTTSKLSWGRRWQCALPTPTEIGREERQTLGNAHVRAARPLGPWRFGPLCLRRDGRQAPRGSSRHKGEQWLAFFDDIGGKFAGSAAADVLGGMDRS